jgi:hypothetical protein
MLAGMTLNTPGRQGGEQPVASLLVLRGLGAEGNGSVPIARA